MNILEQFGSLKEEPRENCKFYRGFLNWKNEFKLDPNWVIEGDFCDYPYRKVWINISDSSIFTYCEGDLTLQIFSDKVEFYGALLLAAKFYANH